ncbi:GntR family transcriptional regulator [Phenylobacterium sp.]|uniref:GntR family transcriptional regulator n=1 Tax=Phenylobacterium sp. TaxID=1871053 RepID=UPI00356ACBDA
MKRSEGPSPAPGGEPRATATPARKSKAASPKTAAEVANALRRQIQDGGLLPGDWLREMRICAEFGVGRSITRSALRILADDGLIQIEENRGAFVAATSMQEVFDLYELRAGLYAVAARFTCIRSDPKFMAETLRMIDQLFQHQESAAPAEDIIHESEAIFSRLASVASPEAQRMIEAVRRKTRWHYSYSGLAEGTGHPFDHWRVLRAGLADRNCAMAAEGARNILYCIQDDVMRLMVSRGFGMQARQTRAGPGGRRRTGRGAA